MFSSGVNIGGGGSFGGGGGGSDRGIKFENFSFAAGLFPTTYAGGAIQSGDTFYNTAASAPDGNGDIKFPLGCLVLALVNAPGQIDANWKIITA